MTASIPAKPASAPASTAVPAKRSYPARAIRTTTLRTGVTKPPSSADDSMTTATATAETNAPAPTKTAGLARSFDAFKVFQKPEMITGIKGLVTLQPLNKGKEAGWFLDNEALETCKWSAKEDDFEAGRVTFNYRHMFGRGDKRTEKHGILITRPKLQVVMKSQLLVEEKAGMNRILGTFQDCADLYEEDKQLPFQERKYNTRVKYLVYLLKDDNTPAHANPIVLTLKNLNSVDMDRKHKAFMDQMQRTLSTALGEDHPLLRGPQFSSVCVFDCELGFETVGANDTEVVNITSYVAPDASTKEAAEESLLALTVPDAKWEETWKLQKSEAMANYIMAHSMQDAARLGGRYGVAPGVNLLPEHMANGRALPEGRDAYGADESF